MGYALKYILDIHVFCLAEGDTPYSNEYCIERINMEMILEQHFPAAWGMTEFLDWKGL